MAPSVQASSTAMSQQAPLSGARRGPHPGLAYDLRLSLPRWRGRGARNVWEPRPPPLARERGTERVGAEASPAGAGEGYGTRASTRANARAVLSFAPPCLRRHGG